MSANFDHKNGSIFVDQISSCGMDEAAYEFISDEFDYSVDQDSIEIIRENNIRAYFRQLCLIKTISFPIELIASLIVMGRAQFNKRIQLQRVIWRYLRNRASKNELIEAVARLGA